MTRRSKPKPGPDHPLVERWDDERGIGNGITVTLLPGHVFYDDCGVMGFDTVRDARDAIRVVAARSARLGDGS